MLHAQWNDLLSGFLDEMETTMTSKGHDYTRGVHDDDKLANFKEAARITGLTPRQVWAVYIAKHWCSIMTWVRTGTLESESLRSRFIDLANYAALGAAFGEAGL